MRSTESRIIFLMVAVLFSVMGFTQTNQLVIRKIIGNYMVADMTKTVPAKNSKEQDRTIIVFTGIFETSDTDGKKPIHKISNYDFTKFTNDKAIVRQNGKAGIFDFSKGTMVEPIVNSQIRELDSTGNLLMEGKTVRLYDKDLKLIKSFPFKNAYAYSNGKFYDGDQNGKNAIIYSSVDGSELFNLGAVEIYETFKDVFIVYIGKKMGIMDAQKNILLPANYLEILFIDNSDDHLKMGLNTENGYQTGLVKYSNGKIEIVFQADNDYVTTIYPLKYKGAEAVYYRGKLNVGADLLDANKNIVKHLNFYKSVSDHNSMEFSNIDDKFITGTDDSYDYYWVADDNGNLVGNKYSSWVKVNEKELKDHYIFTCDYPYHSTIINTVTKQKFEYDDLLYETDKINNTLVFETENGRYVYFKINKERNELQPILPNSMTGWNNEIMELPVGYIPIQLAKNSYMVYDAFNDKEVSSGDLNKVRNDLVKYIISELNKEFGVKNPPSDELKKSVSCAPYYNSGSVPTYNYKVDGIELFGKDSLHHAVNFYRNYFVHDSKTNIGTMSLYLDYSQPDIFLSAVFDENYNMILPFQEGQIQVLGKVNAGGTPDGYVIYSVYSDSMFVLLPKWNKRIPNKTFSFMKVSEEMAGFYLYGDLLYIEDWMTNYSYLMDLSGVVVKKFKLSDVELFDEDHIVTFGEKSSVYFINTRKELLLKGQSAYRMNNTNVLIIMDETTEESKLYNIKTGELVVAGKYDNMSGYNSLYAIVSQGEKSAVLHLQQAKLVTDFNLTNEQAIEFIEKQPDYLELQKQEKMKYEELIKAADKFFSRKEWSNALLNYMEAKKFSTDQSYSNQQITATNKAIHREDSMKLELDKKYMPLIRAGDSLIELGDYRAAIPYYERGLMVKMNDPYAASKIYECKLRIAESDKKMALEKAFLETMAQGDKFMKDKDYQKAIDAFQKALSYRPNDPTPVSKIQECNDAMK